MKEQAFTLYSDKQLSGAIHSIQNDKERHQLLMDEAKAPHIKEYYQQEIKDLNKQLRFAQSEQARRNLI